MTISSPLSTLRKCPSAPYSGIPSLIIFIGSKYGVYTATTVEEWSAVLSLADRWAFHDIRELAIAQLAPIASDIEKIVLGRKYGINQWLGAAYLAVCVREQSLTKEEGKLMTVDDIVEISSIRQQSRTGAHPRVAPSLSIEDVCARFGLLTPTSQSAATEAVGPPSDLVAGSALITPLESQAISPANLIEKHIRLQEPVLPLEELNPEEKAKAEIGRAHV